MDYFRARLVGRLNVGRWTLNRRCADVGKLEAGWWEARCDVCNGFEVSREDGSLNQVYCSYVLVM